MEIVCAWCQRTLGFKPPYEDKSITHGICDKCLTEHFPHHAEKIERIVGDEKERAGLSNPMITDIDTCLRDLADFYVQKRREMTPPELHPILLKHCGSEAEVKKFASFLETEPGQLRFKTLLKDRERLPELETRLRGELHKEFRKEGLLPEKPEAVPEAELIADLKRGAEYEGRFWFGAYGYIRLRWAKDVKDAPIHKMVAMAREHYNTLRVKHGFEPVTDWTKRPDDTLEKRLRELLGEELE